MTSKHQTVLVAGASGELGKRTVRELIRRKSESSRIIAASRTPAKLSEFADEGVEVRKADFDDPSTLPAAFAGVDRLLLVSTNRFEEPGLRVRQHAAALEAAEHAGVRHVVYTSFAHHDSGSPMTVVADHAATEALLENRRLDFTILRNNQYLEYVLPAVRQAAETGIWWGACGTGRAAYVTRSDCARAAAGALLDGFDGRRTLVVSGPQALTRGEIAAVASDVIGRSIEYRETDPYSILRAMVAAGMPNHVAEMIVSIDLGIARGELADVSDVVETLGKRPAVSIEAFFQEHLAELR